MGETARVRQEAPRAYRPDLYGAQLFLQAEQPREVIREHVILQEMTHIAEGIALKQTTVRHLERRGDKLIGFGDQDIEAMARAGYAEARERYERGERSASYLMQRRGHDVAIAQKVKRLAAEGAEGEALLVLSPYGEELGDKGAAQILGHWPKYRRSFMWLYRKQGEAVECTDITIDQSQVSTYRALLTELGVETPANVTSHDLPGYITSVGAFATNEDRSDFVSNLRREYYRLQSGHSESPAENEEQEALEFLRVQAYHHLSLLADVHEAIGRTLETNQLDPLVQTSAQLALQHLDCLNDTERAQLQRLVHGIAFGEDKLDALTSLVLAQRYGIWQVVNKLLQGEMPVESPSQAQAHGLHTGTAEHIRQQLMLIYAHTNQAANMGLVMPGCGGPTSFLRQDADMVRDSIFGEREEQAAIPSQIRCIKCRQYSPKEAVVGKNDWHCPKCKYQIDICTGQVLHGSVTEQKSSDRIAELKASLGKQLGRAAVDKARQRQAHVQLDKA